MPKKHFPIHRARIDDIIVEFSVPPTERLRKKGRVALIAKGAPGMPGGSSFLEFLARQGFYAILPRYRGTWESSGTFLKKEPTEDLRDVLDFVTKGFLVDLFENKKYLFPKNPEVYIFAGSFGGPAGLFLSSDTRVRKVFAYAPVVDWRAAMPEEPLEEFALFSKHLFGEGYRFAKNGVEKLVSGKFYNPATAKNRTNGEKIHIFHSKDDAIVPYMPSVSFAEEIGAEYTVFARGGHGGASSVMEPRVWKIVSRYL